MKKEGDTWKELATNTSKKTTWFKFLPCVILGLIILYLIMFSELPNKASVILSPGAIHITNIIQSGKNMVKNSFGIGDYAFNDTFFDRIEKVQSVNFGTNLSYNENGYFPENIKTLWKSHYVNGVPVKPAKTFPTCDQFIQQLRDPQSKYQLIAMYDPGNCAEIPNTHIQVFKDLAAGDEKKELLAGQPLYELTDLCTRVNASLGDPNWRLCYGMPNIYHYGTWVHQRYIYGVNFTNATEKLGPDCFDKQLSLFFFQPNLDHKGGPRKVLNNLLSGFRLIGKPYITNGRKLELFDYLFSPDPHHGYFMYYMGESDARKFYIGPTVIYSQINAHRITDQVRKYSHIVAASKRALMSNQYFPKMPLKHENSVIIPTGIDEAIFTPSNKSRTDALIYLKSGCYMPVVKQVKSLITVKITQIHYGAYTEADFRKALESARYAIVCDGTETQGIAMQEMMAMNVPLFVTNPESVPYFSDEVGLILSRNIPLNVSFSRFVYNVNKGVYRPRKWLVENLGIVNSVINTMKVFCGLPNKWNPEMKGKKST